MRQFLDKDKGTWVLLCFMAFFALIVSVNTIFIKTALKTHSGVVTKQPYEKGLAYNDVLKQARSQPDLNSEVSYSKGMLRWVLGYKNGDPVNAKIEGLIIRPIMQGYDFKINLKQIEPGIYEVPLELPLKGQWKVQLKASWGTSQYQTVSTFLAN